MLWHSDEFTMKQWCHYRIFIWMKHTWSNTRTHTHKDISLISTLGWLRRVSVNQKIVTGQKRTSNQVIVVISNTYPTRKDNHVMVTVFCSGTAVPKHTLKHNSQKCHLVSTFNNCIYTRSNLKLPMNCPFSGENSFLVSLFTYLCYSLFPEKHYSVCSNGYCI